ncbi:hypothetical protein H1R20_g15948, partial [Candolleomyces eurysporus]
MRASSDRFQGCANLSYDSPVRTLRFTLTNLRIKLRLNVDGTPGFADQVNNEGCWGPIIKYIKDQHSA